MEKKEFVEKLRDFGGLEIVKQYKSSSPTDYTFEIYVDMEKKIRTQLLRVVLPEDKKIVMALSVIGKYSNDTEMLINLLKENVDGNYSRICIYEDELFQIYKYPIDELDYLEMAKAFSECARYADIYEKKYFGGVDKA